MTGENRVLGMYIPTGDPETCDMSSLFVPGQLGKTTQITQPTNTAAGDEAGRTKVYRLVHTDSSMTVAPFKGAVAWWENKSRYRVTTAATNRGARAGVFQNAVTKGNYGFIQIKGPATVKFVDAPTATPDDAGLIVIPSGTAGKADCLAAGSAATYPPLGNVAVNPNWNPLEATAVVELEIPEEG